MAHEPVDAQDDPKAASVGRTVKVVDEHSGERDTYTLVESGEADPARGRVSVESPIAQALEGHREGDIVPVETPRARRMLRLVEVES